MSNQVTESNFLGVFKKIKYSLFVTFIYIYICSFVMIPYVHLEQQ